MTLQKEGAASSAARQGAGRRGMHKALPIGALGARAALSTEPHCAAGVRCAGGFLLYSLQTEETCPFTEEEAFQK